MIKNYYHRTHKNYEYGSKGKPDHFDCPTNLFSLNNTDTVMGDLTCQIPHIHAIPQSFL